MGQVSTQPPQRDAVRVGPGAAGAGSDHGVGPPADQSEREGALHLGAHAYATAAGDAQIPVQVDVGVAVVAASPGPVGRRRDAQRIADEPPARHRPERRSGSAETISSTASRRNRCRSSSSTSTVGARPRAGVTHAATTCPSTRTRQVRQEPAGVSRSSWHRVGQLDAGRAARRRARWRRRPRRRPHRRRRLSRVPPPSAVPQRRGRGCAPPPVPAAERAQAGLAHHPQQPGVLLAGRIAGRGEIQSAA